MELTAYGQLKIDDNQLFLIGNEPSSAYTLHYYKITFGDVSVDWANKISWTGGSWSASNSESLLSSDNSLIYTFATFGSTQYLYFITFSTSTGNVVGSRYKSSSTWTGAWEAVLNQYSNYYKILHNNKIVNLILLSKIFLSLLSYSVKLKKNWEETDVIGFKYPQY